MQKVSTKATAIVFPVCNAECQNLVVIQCFSSWESTSDRALAFTEVGSDAIRFPQPVSIVSEPLTPVIMIKERS